MENWTRTPEWKLQRSKFYPSIIMSCLMMNYSTLAQAPWGVASSQSSQRNVQMTGLWESVPGQTGESTRASPGSLWALVYVNPFLQAYWPHKLLCDSVNKSTIYVFSNPHIWNHKGKENRKSRRVLLSAIQNKNHFLCAKHCIKHLTSIFPSVLGKNPMTQELVSSPFCNWGNGHR